MINGFLEIWIAVVMLLVGYMLGREKKGEGQMKKVTCPHCNSVLEFDHPAPDGEKYWCAKCAHWFEEMEKDGDS